MLLRAHCLPLIASLLVLVCALPGAAVAADAPRSGLGVSPSSVIQEAVPGDSVVIPIELNNTTNSTVRVESSTLAGKSAPSAQSLVAPDTKAAADPTRNASSWVSFPKRVIVIGPNARSVVQATVEVPRNARPGVHAVLALFSVRTTTPGSGGAGVSGKAGLASTLLLEVPGDAQASARIVSTTSPKVRHGDDRLTFSALVENTGDTLLRIDAEVRLDAPWSAARVLRTDEQLVLPGGSRRVTMHYDDPPFVGRFTPQLVVVGGAGSDVRVSKELPTLWLLPPWWLVAALVVSLVLAVLGVRARRRERHAHDDDE